MTNKIKIDLTTNPGELGLVNTKQLRFVNDYIFSDNITKSGVNAGYSKNYSQANLGKLLEDVRVKSYVTEKRKELYDKLQSEKIASKEEILEILTRVARNEEREEVVLSTEYGIERVNKDVSIKDRIKAVELIGKSYGAWTEKADINVNVPTIVFDIGEEYDE